MDQFNPMQYQQKRYFIKNNLNSKLLLQNNAKEIICRLDPKQTSFETFSYEELRNNTFVQVLLSKGMISLTEERIEEPKVVHQNFGQKYLIGTRCEIVGKHHLIITIQQYIPQTGQYKAKLEKTGGLMTLTEREIQPLTAEGEALNNPTNPDVDIVVNQTVEQRPKAKNVKDIMAEAQAELNNTEYEMPQIVTVNNSQDTQVENSFQSEEQKALQREYEEEQKKMQASVKQINQNKVEPIAQAPEDDEVEENIYIMKPNKQTNKKFASEVSTRKIIKDTMKQQEKIVSEMANDLKKEEVKEISNNDILEQIPEEYKSWFNIFLNKDDRKKKMTIALCKDIEKLKLIIAYCGEYEANLAEQRLQNLSK